MSSTRFMATVLTLAFLPLVGGWHGVRAFPRTSPAEAQQGPGPVEQQAKPVTMARPIPERLQGAPPVFPDLLDARDASAMTIVRTTIDQSGAVAEARIVRFSLRLRSAASPETTISADGDDILPKLERMFNEASARTGQSRSPAEVRGAAEAFMEAALTRIREWQFAAPVEAPLWFDVAVSFANGTSAASPVVAGPSPSAGQQPAADQSARSPLLDGAIRVGGGVAPPKKVRDVRPLYPQEARDAGIQGVVILEVRIEGDGSVSQGRVLRSIPLLDQPALDAVRQWEFTPTLLNGVPTPVVMTVTIQFTLAP